MQKKREFISVRLAAVLGLSSVVAFGVVYGNLGDFELDGNALSDGGVDWATLYGAAATGGQTNGGVYSGLEVDGSGNKTIFAGNSKDILDIGDWQWKDEAGGLPDKDNITNASAFAKAVDGKLVIYAHADRFANDGDAQMGFWFFQKEVLPVNVRKGGAFTFSGTHVVNDLLVLANFENGGQSVTVKAYKWVGGANPLQEIGTGAKCGASSSNQCGIANEGLTPIASPWSYSPKQGAAGPPYFFPTASFFEVAINVTDALGVTPCFASFLAETRSSSSTSATLKDFSGGKFNVCGIEIAKACTGGSINADGKSIKYTFGGTVKNIGLGTLYNVVVTDTFPTDATGILPLADVNISATVKTYNIGTLLGNACTGWPKPLPCVGGTADPNSLGTFNVPLSLNGPTNNASVSSTVATDTSSTKVEDTADPAACPTVNILPSLSADKSCSVGLSNVLAATVTFGGKVCNTSTVAISITKAGDVQTFPDGSTAAGGTVVFSGGLPFELAPNACKDYTGSYSPTKASSGSYACDYKFADRVTVEGNVVGLPLSKVSQQASIDCPLCACTK